MALQQFTWCPDKDATGETTRRTREVQFGDGYKQSAGDGINGASQKWPLTFTKRRDEAVAIKSFLDDHKGYISFAWQPPLEPLGLYQAKTSTLTPLGAGWYRISVTFEQSFHP
ncbi:phage tail protein [Vibrio vulnificus]|uniref:phage tail protein n=1 Tax=Vibrio vulnificus TaxID=672 RepID=UPI00102A9CA8|nr:phage tail protein [Vibrio vulnificus]EKZ9178138.1 phage tail protein [Vibrio vulnificus]RZQ02586.1 phage tail protein [Vibrio vulnificus]